MPRYTAPLLICAPLIICIAAISPATAKHAHSAQWQTFTAPDGSYSIDVPEPVKLDEGEGDVTMDSVGFRIDEDDMDKTYEFSVSDGTPTGKSDADLLAYKIADRKAAYPGLNATQIQINGNPGVMLSNEIKDSVSLELITVERGKIYDAAAYNKANKSGAEVNRFVQSFHLLR